MAYRYDWCLFGISDPHPAGISRLELVIARAERAIAAARRQSENQDLYLDSAALSLHDFYTVTRQSALAIDVPPMPFDGIGKRP